MIDINAHARKLGITVRNSDFLLEALTHRSYLNENKLATKHNERLEFLGDAVLELVVTGFLFHKFPKNPEGDLTSYRSALVNTQSLCESSEALGVNDMLLLSKGEKKDVGHSRQVILANAFEAIIGAIYLDTGLEAVTQFIAKHIFPKIDRIVSERLWQDAKSRFQEMAQEHRGVTPKYTTLSEDGPDHQKHFVLGVFLDDEQIATGEGRSKQDAQQDAAAAALKKTNW